MKKILFSLLILLSPVFLTAQVKIGLKLSPTLNFNRIEAASDSLETKSDGPWIRGIFGVFADIQFSENYNFNTGLFYVLKGIGVKVADLEDNSVYTARYNIEYIQIPIDLKLYTDEIALDKRLYFQVGVTVDVKIKDSAVQGYDPMVSKFKPVDTNFIFGGGLEARIGENTRLFGGLTYYRGLINIVDSSIEDIAIRTDMLALDLGIKF